MSPRGGKRKGAGRPPKMGKPVEAGIKVNLTAEDRMALDQAATRKEIGPSELARTYILRGLALDKKRKDKG
jgi:hypothetical protein